MPESLPRPPNAAFVSYSQQDNQPTQEGERGWVEGLADALQKHVGGEIFRPSRRDNDELSSGHWREAIENSATLLVILSNHYLQSRQCERELARFLQTHGGPKRAADRILLVRCEEVAFEDQPPLLREVLGYSFYEKGATGAARRLGEPRPEESDRAYWNRVLELSEALANRLRQTDQPALEATHPARPAVYLATQTFDPRDRRQEIKRYLEEVGLRVLPESHYPSDPRQFARRTDADLANEDCVLFVQLLSEIPPLANPVLPSGYEGLQWERALASGKPTLRWRDRNSPLDAVGADYRKTLTGVDVAASNLAELKRMIVKRVEKERILRQTKTIGGQKDSGKFLLVNAAAPDLSSAYEVAKRLLELGASSEIIDEGAILAEFIEEDDYDALLVFYGRCEQKWLRDQLRCCRRILMDKKISTVGVYCGPPDDKPPPPILAPRIQVLDPQQPEALRNFVDSLKEPKASRKAASHPTEPSVARDQIFIGHCRQDQRWLKRFQDVLEPLVQGRTLDVWAETRPGGDRRRSIQAAISETRAAVLLVSIDFLASDFIRQEVLPPVLTAAENGELVLIWIPVGASPYEETPIAQYQAAHAPERPLSKLGKAAADEALVAIAKMVRNLLDGNEKTP